MVSVRLYVEGGGDSKEERIRCREAFSKLFARAGFKGPMPKVDPGGGREQTFDRFKTAMRASLDRAIPVLLVDSEAPVTQGAWEHLHDRDGWLRPDGATDEQAQLMVQCMETWCITDRTALGAFFGQQLQESALPSLHNLEDRSKDEVQQALAHATRDCGRDRTYRKGRRSFRLVAQLDPGVLKQHLPHFTMLCALLDRLLTIPPERRR